MIMAVGLRCYTNNTPAAPANTLTTPIFLLPASAPPELRGAVLALVDVLAPVVGAALSVSTKEELRLTPVWTGGVPRRLGSSDKVSGERRDSRLDEDDCDVASIGDVDEEDGEDICAVDRPRKEKTVRRRECDFIASKYNFFL